MQLLQQLVSVHATSGNESAMKDYILDYVSRQSHNWQTTPQVISGDSFQDCVILVFGMPRTAVYAHIDSIGYTVRYNNHLVKIGGPVNTENIILAGKDSQGDIEAMLKWTDESGQDLYVDFPRTIDPGTDLVFKAHWRETDEFIQCCYMDNRLGVWNALKLCETITDGAIVFSTYEEHGGGSVGFLSEYLYRNYHIRQALISDITWVTEGVKAGEGVAISLRDRGIPRKTFVNKILELASRSGIAYQCEVEGAGSSDGGYLQSGPLPIDWCFIGAPEQFVHSPDEMVHKRDIESMLAMYRYLMLYL